MTFSKLRLIFLFSYLFYGSASFAMSLDSLRSMDSSKNIPVMTKKMLEKVESMPEEFTGKNDLKLILKELNVNAIKYFNDIDRLFFFSYWYKVNAENIRSQTHKLRNFYRDHQDSHEVRFIYDSVMISIKRWEKLHNSYKYYKGYFF